jgi:sugar phosphate isomerase/epimerase
MSTTVLCSTGVFTRGPDHTDHNAILQNAPKIGTKAFELAVYAAWYGHLDQVVEDLGKADLTFPVVHADKGIGVGLGSEDAEDADEALAVLEVNCRAAAALGAKTLVVHLWELPTGDDDFERNLERLPLCLDTAGAYNVVLAVETIPGRSATPLSNLKLALEADTRCAVTLDTEFLAFHGQLSESLEADWLWTDNRVRHVHLKDFDGRLREGGVRRYLLPGEGSLDLQGYLDGLSQRGYGGAVTLEASALAQTGAIDEARLEQIAGVLKQLGAS